MMLMHIRKMRRFGSERVLGVPREFWEKMHTEFMTVNIDNSGRLIYTPVRDA
jgi:hypothetical protein